MKHRLLPLLLTLAVLLGAGSLVVLAAYTANGGELVSLGWLEKTFLPRAVTAGEEVYQRHEDAIADRATQELEAMEESYDFRLGAADGSLPRTDALTGLRFKQGDEITLSTGSSLLLLAGEATLRFPHGAVVDVSAGQEVKSETPLQKNTRLLVAERTLATVIIQSNTAVLALEGTHSLISSNHTDYNMLAGAMKAMGLFKGSDTAYGEGFDLEQTPTRIQGLIMFLRLLGEEPAALATTAPCPFTDVPAWAQPYVAYAFSKGYTKGVSQTEFGPGLGLRAMEYITFVLRALGYSDSGTSPDFAWDTSLAKGLHLGLLTPREHKLLTEEPFLRAQVVYVSYFALDARPKGTEESLVTRLTASGALDKAAVDAAREAVTTPRLK